MPVRERIRIATCAGWQVPCASSCAIRSASSCASSSRVRVTPRRCWTPAGQGSRASASSTSSSSRRGSAGSRARRVSVRPAAIARCRSPRRCAKSALSVSISSGCARKLVLRVSSAPSRRSPPAEDLHLSVAEAVDRLLLVADRQQVAVLERPQQRKLARVDILELIDHDQGVAAAPARSQPAVSLKQRQGAELEVVVVEAPRRLLVGGKALVKELEQAGEERGDRARLALALLPAAATGARGGQRRRALTARAQLVIDGEDRLLELLGRIGAQLLALLAGELLHQRAQGLLVGARPQQRRVSLLKDAEARLQRALEGLLAQQHRAEAVEGADEGAAQPAALQAPLALAKPRGHALAQLRCGAHGEGDREQPLGRDLLLEHRAHEALDEHARLARAGRRADQERRNRSCQHAALLIDEVPGGAHRSCLQTPGWAHPPLEQVSGRASISPSASCTAASCAAATVACSSSASSCAARRSVRYAGRSTPASSAPRGRRSGPPSG